MGGVRSQQREHMNETMLKKQAVLALFLDWPREVMQGQIIVHFSATFAKLYKKFLTFGSRFRGSIRGRFKCKVNMLRDSTQNCG